MRGVLIGAVIGSIVGLLVGLVVHALVGEDDLLGYEIVAGLCGLVAGIALGAFYGGASRLPRHARRDPPR
jgi:hypothetical protein